jgi:hypothetical protein
VAAAFLTRSPTKSMSARSLVQDSVAPAWLGADRVRESAYFVVTRRRRAGPPTGYRPRRPIGLPSASASTQTRVSGATWRGALRSVAPASSRVARVASRSSTSA